MVTDGPAAAGGASRRLGAASPFDRLAASEEPLAAVVARHEQAGANGRFTVESDVIPPGLRCQSCGRRHLPRRLRVLDAHRFEGPSSPDDEAIVVVVECPACGVRGVLVSAYGPAASAEEAEVLADLGAAYGRAGNEQAGAHRAVRSRHGGR